MCMWSCRSYGWSQLCTQLDTALLSLKLHTEKHDLFSLYLDVSERSRATCTSSFWVFTAKQRATD